MNFDQIAERRLTLIDEATGLQTPLCIQIGRPQWTEVDLEARCPVLIQGLMGAALDIYGSDLLNALECALSFVNTELSNISSPCKVLWPDGETYFD